MPEVGPSLKELAAMAGARMPAGFFRLAAHHLPPEQPPGPAGGRPALEHRQVVNVLWFVLATGCRWDDVPPEMGCSTHKRVRCRGIRPAAPARAAAFRSPRRISSTSRASH